MPKLHSPISQRIDSILDFDKRVFFLILVILFLITRVIINDIILQSIPGYEKLESDGSLSYFHIFNTLNYIWTPFSLLWKFTLTAFVIWTGSFTFGFKVSFKKIWEIVMVGEIIFLIPELIKILMFLNPPTDVNYLDVQNFYPLSLFQLFNPAEIHPKFYYPLKAINIFELIYVVFLVLGFHTVSFRSLKESAIVIIFSYFLFFLLWLSFYVLVYKS